MYIPGRPPTWHGYFSPVYQVLGLQEWDITARADTFLNHYVFSVSLKYFEDLFFFFKWKVLLCESIVSILSNIHSHLALLHWNFSGFHTGTQVALYQHTWPQPDIHYVDNGVIFLQRLNSGLRSKEAE